MDDDRFVPVNQHFDAGDERFLQLRGQHSFNNFPAISYQLKNNSFKDFFTKEFSLKPSFFVKVPGRVNLIGEHVDYSGYAVCPMVSNKFHYNRQRQLFYISKHFF